MPDIPIHNPGTNPMPCGNLMIPPGETRLIDEGLVPPHLRGVKPTPAVAAAPEMAPHPFVDLLSGTVAQVVKSLPDLSDGELTVLLTVETENSNRKGVATGIAEEQLRRAANDKGDEQVAFQLAEFAADLSEMDLPELEGCLELYSEDPERLALVQNEIEHGDDNHAQ